MHELKRAVHQQMATNLNERNCSGSKLHNVIILYFKLLLIKVIPQVTELLILLFK